LVAVMSRMDAAASSGAAPSATSALTASKPASRRNARRPSAQPSHPSAFLSVVDSLKTYDCSCDVDEGNAEERDHQPEKQAHLR
jgi:hypothetical protein